MFSIIILSFLVSAPKIVIKKVQDRNQIKKEQEEKKRPSLYYSYHKTRHDYTEARDGYIMARSLFLRQTFEIPESLKDDFPYIWRDYIDSTIGDIGSGNFDESIENHRDKFYVENLRFILVVSDFPDDTNYKNVVIESWNELKEKSKELKRIAKQYESNTR